MWRRWRVREFNFGLPSFQTSYSAVSCQISSFFALLIATIRKKVETVIHSDNSFATVAFLRIKDAVLESKSAESLTASIPPLLSDQYNAVRNTILSSQEKSRTAELPSMNQPALTFNHSTMATSSLQKNNWVAISNVQTNGFQSESDMTVEEEVTKCFQILTGRFNNFIHDFLKP